MATKINHYYVLLFTEEGAKYVTGIGDHHTAHWDMLKAPKEFSKTYAEDVTKGLLINGFNAAMVMMPIEVLHQPYRYENGKFEWKRNDNKM